MGLETWAGLDLILCGHSLDVCVGRWRLRCWGVHGITVGADLVPG